MRPAIHERPLRLRPRVQTRGEDTRRRLIETAIAAFGELGFEGAGTRLLTERAGVNLPAIQYHFGSKEGLYRAAVDHIARYIEQQMAPVGSRVRRTLAGNKKVSRRVVSSLLRKLLDDFVLLVFGGGERDRRKHVKSHQLFIARAEVEQTLDWARTQASAIVTRAQDGAEKLLTAAGLGPDALAEVATAIVDAAHSSTEGSRSRSSSTPAPEPSNEAQGESE